MKFANQLVASLVCAGLIVTLTAQDAVKFEVPGVTSPAKPAAPAPAPAKAAPAATKAPASASAASAPAAAPAAGGAAVKYSEAQLMEAYGYIFMLETRMASQLQALEMTPAHKEAMVRGIALALGGNDLPYDPQQVQAQLQDFMGKRQAGFLNKIKAAQTAAGNEHFAKLKADKNVVELPSGLRYEITQPGKGAVPKPGQVVTIHYTGSLAGGQVFDSSLQPRQPGAPVQPAEFLLAVASEQNPNGVIPGMFEGIQKTGVGGKLKLHIPPALAYGEEGAPGAIPPGATLIFDIEILGVKDAPPAPAAK